MIVDATVQFWAWVHDLAAKAAEGDAWARDRHDLTLALLTELAEREAAPGGGDETATLTRVLQAGDDNVWRMCAELENGAAVRLLCSFPEGSDSAVIACLVGDTTRIGDVFYRNVAPRTEAVMDAWTARREGRDAPTSFTPAGEQLAAALDVPGTADRISGARALMRRADQARVELLEARARALA